MMTLIKNFSLFIMLNFISSYAMDHSDAVDNSEVHQRFVNIQFASIWNKIDKDHVGVSDCVMNVQWHLKPFVSSCLSMYKGYRLTPEQAAKEWDKIQSYIPSYIDKNNALQELVERHWYVHYVMKALADQKERELEYITGSDIDTLHDIKAADLIVLSCACKNILDKSVIDMMPQVISDVHFTALEHPHGHVQPRSLVMSSDGKYLRATATNNKYAMWDMEMGELVETSDIKEEDIEWIKGHTYGDSVHKQNALFGGYSCSLVERYRVVDSNNQYCARVANPYMGIDSEFLPQKTAHNPKAIILFKKPQVISYFLQKAFDNSYTKSEELKSLRNSEVLKSIKGFLRKNCEIVIDKRIKQLTAQ